MCSSDLAPRHVGSSRTRARTLVPCIGRRILNHCATREALPPVFTTTPSCLAWVSPLSRTPWMAQDARPRVPPWWSGMAGFLELRGDALRGSRDVVRPLCRSLVTLATCLSESPTAQQTRCMTKCLRTSHRASTTRILSATLSSAPSGRWSVGRGWAWAGSSLALAALPCGP